MIQEHDRFRETLFIGMTFLVGFVLTIVPFPRMLMWYRPSIVLLILLFWLLHRPHRVGVAVSFCIGLLLDLLSGSLLGVHALIFTLMGYGVLKSHRFMRGLSVGQKLLMVLLFELIDLSLQYLIEFYFHAEPDTWRYWIPVFTTTLFWPVVVASLTTRRRRRRIL
ncbi:MAG: rod shape-determining protein MreD [Coxiella sp. RIFCSPHIGHO2_12_FULL_42_15]|nr:MAG: rod shape-determining protein MreD [Coxiella sp. RIFCSPHIGHO2_12_FULL_42_15]